MVLDAVDTVQVGRSGRPVSDVAGELGCDWYTVNDAVVAYGEALLATDTDRVGTVNALGLDETLFLREGERHFKQWYTSIVDVGGPGRQPKLVEVIEGRTAAKASAWLDEQPEAWLMAIRWGCWTCRARTARPSRTASAMSPRSRTRFTCTNTPTPRSMSVVGGCRTKRSATGATRTTRCTGAAGC